ncbi:hypothetical protein SASPL_149025 [Salvia splendens]|uniref:Arf-GAP domain-containing protein n=1 Tax=Salvia splendens TaxID=180675 RepID=A0A8X8Z3Z3_SALSN|nr:uncharacterized protein LOC121779159 [Salvia splendens]KAG6391272.1 hypothetical protein SASPL_149025 [Salvia splendens]
MPRRVKEEEKVEMIIRGLLKQPDNRRCINCNALGAQYVCTTFWTFVCTNCSGVHREFNHRVKSVSLAKFSDEEIMSLQAGGNERAKQIYFKSWDPYHKSYPNSSNLERLREFVKSVYIDRKYAGENSSNKLQMAQSEPRNALCEWPSERSRWGRRDDYVGRSPGSSSCGRDEFRDHSLFERSFSSGGLNLKDFLEERSPINSHVMPRSISHRSRSTHFEIIDDRFRDDGGVKRYERNSGSGGRSPCSIRSTSSVSPVNSFLGGKSPDLRVVALDDHKASPSGHEKVVAAAASKEKENEAANSTSLIDFLDAKPPKANEQVASETSNESRSIVPMNSVEALLFELSDPTPSSPASASQMSLAVATVNSANNATDVETEEAPGVPDCPEPLALTVMKSDQTLHRDVTNHVMQHVHTHHIMPPNTTIQSASSVESSLNEQGCRSLAPDDLRRTKSVSNVQSLRAANTSPCSRKEIPENLFSSGFVSFNPAVVGWQMHLPHGGMQFHHHPALHVATYQNPLRPRNPFDIDDDDRIQIQAATFMAMSPLHGAHPNMLNPAASQPQPSPYYLSPQSYMTPYGMNMPQVPEAYMAQLPNNMLLARPEGNGNFGTSEDAFASLNPITRSLPSSPLPRGNPFL